MVAVGTTVVRALETTVDSRGISHPGRTWTDLVIGPHHELGVVDGLITGWHEPESTHLDSAGGSRRAAPPRRELSQAPSSTGTYGTNSVTAT